MGRKRSFPKYGKKNSVGTMENLRLLKSLKETEDKLDLETVKTMKKCLGELTTSGSPSLDNLILKQFKQLCRKSDDYVKYAFLLIMQQLQKKHSEIRLSAFQVANELFYRSHAFRECLITHLQEFLTLTTELETGQLLPPPKAVATRLKTDVLRTIQEWHEKFGKAYRKLAVGYDYLKNCKHVDFDNIQAQNLAERQRIEEEESKKQRLMTERLAKVLSDIADNKEEIQDCIKEADNCLKLILPNPFDFSLTASCINGKEDHKETPLYSSKTDDKKHNNSSVENFDNKKTCENNSFNEETQTVLRSSHSEPNSNSETVKGQENSKEESLVDQVNNSQNLNDLHSTCEGAKTQQEKSTTESTHGKVSDGEKLFNEGCTSHSNANFDCESKSSEVNDDLSYVDSYEDDNIDSKDEEDDFNLQVHGFQRPGFSLTIEVLSKDITIRETEDNAVVMQSLKDSSKLIGSSYLPKVTKWLELLSKNGAKEQDIKAIIDLKVNLETVNGKCRDLNLIVKENVQDFSDSDDEDLEEVPEKEGYEPRIPEHLREEYGLSAEPSSSVSRANSSPSVPLKRKAKSDFTLSGMDHGSEKKKPPTIPTWSLKHRASTGSIGDPTSRAAALVRIQQENPHVPSTSKNSHEWIPGSSSLSNCQEKSNAEVPYVKFGKDLAHWENPDEIEVPSIIKYDSLHRFWTPAENEAEKPSEHEKATLQYRVINFTGNFEPVKWKCRASMPNGKLCERMDRIKCPFHGKIIARDKDGKPSNVAYDETTDASKQEEKSCGDQEVPPWKDPELQREIEAATGHDLGSTRSQKLLDRALQKRKGKGRGKKSSNLTDIKAATNTVRKRLEKKVFNKGAMKKVCSRLDAADYKRVRDKFGNQFNYSLH